MNNASLIAELQSIINKAMDFIVKAGISLVPRIVPSTSCAQMEMQWSWLAIRGMRVGPHTGYGSASLAKQPNSESF